LDTTTLKDGNYAIRFFANDTVNNVNNTEFVNITIDNTPPSISDCQTDDTHLAKGETANLACIVTDNFAEVANASVMVTVRCDYNSESTTGTTEGPIPCSPKGSTYLDDEEYRNVTGSFSNADYNFKLPNDTASKIMLRVHGFTDGTGSYKMQVYNETEGFVDIDAANLLDDHTTSSCSSWSVTGGSGGCYEWTVCSSETQCDWRTGANNMISIRYSTTVAGDLHIDYQAIMINSTLFEESNSWWNTTYICGSSGNFSWSNTFAMDKLSQLQSTSESIEILCDFDPPELKLPIYTNRTWSTSNGELTLNVSLWDSTSDLSGDCSVEIGGVSAGTITPSNGWCNDTLTVPSLSEDDQFINVSIDDVAGLTGWNNSYSTRLDNTGPSVQLPEYTNATLRKSGGSVDLDVQVSDSGSGLTGGCTVKIGGTEIAESPVFVSNGWCNVSATVPSLSTGNHTINVSIFDSVELQGWNDSFVLDVDNDAPSPSLEQSNVTTPDPLDAVEFGAYWNDVGDADLSRYIFSWNATDTWVNDSDLAFSGAEGVWTNATKQINAAWEGKIIGWTVWANDTLGNMGVSAEKTITVNSDNPSVEIELPTNESTIYSTQDIFTTITDAGTIQSTLWRWENSTDNGDWTTLTQGTPSSSVSFTRVVYVSL
jgi:hypothetical protein